MLYALVRVNNPTTFLSVTLTKGEALEYFNTLLRAKHFDDFKLWCNVKNHDVTEPDIWYDYYDECISDEETRQYSINKVYFTLDSIASIIRVMNKCQPLNCSFETAFEKVCFDEIKKAEEDEVFQ